MNNNYLNNYSFDSRWIVPNISPILTSNQQKQMLDIKQESKAKLLLENSNEAAVEAMAFYSMDGKTMTSEIMHNFLLNKVFNSVSVMVPHVAQKSYGSEKRFLCPPPAITFDLREYAKLRPNETENSQETENCEKICGRVFIKQLPQNWLLIHSNSLKDSQTLKSLFVSDSDHVKDFQVQLKLVYDRTYDLGSFLSNDVRVISKPSKKKQTQKANDLCIESGSKVALFNRLRSQNVNTRYLLGDVDQMTVNASSKMWGIFYIHLVCQDEPDSDEFVSLTGNITYGSCVKFVSTENGMALPRLIIRKVDKQNVFLDCVEGVSQLHKCAFNISSNYYLSLNHEDISKSESTRTSDQYVDIINDNSIWTIISADANEVLFYEALGPTPFPISPAPKVISTEVVNLNDDCYRLVLKGEKFHPQHTIWFGSVPSKTVFVSQYHIECAIPPISEFSSRANLLDGKYLTVEIFLVRDDGVIFHTAKSFTFNPTDHFLADGIIHPLPFGQLKQED